MKRTTIFIDEALERDLRALAEREKRPVSGLVREALGAYVAQRKKASPGPSFVALGRSGHRDTAEKHEELLWQDPPNEAERSQRKSKRGRSAESGPSETASDGKRG
jgi:predicted transcriptional regulator